MIAIFTDEEEVVKAYIRSERGQVRRRVLQESLEKAARDVERADEIKSGLYADYREGLWDEQEYLLMNREYSNKVEALKQKMQETAEYLNRFDRTPLYSRTQLIAVFDKVNVLELRLRVRLIGNENR